MSRFSLTAGNSILTPVIVLSFATACTGTIAQLKERPDGGARGSTDSPGGSAGEPSSAEEGGSSQGGMASGSGGRSSSLTGRGGSGNPSGGTTGTAGVSGGSNTGGGMVSPNGVAVSVSPRSVAMLPSGNQQFTCTVTGSTNTMCTWSVTESGGGSITASGAYSAPATAGTFHVVAKSAADAMASASATVIVTDHQVGKCDSLAAAGTWENVTPMQLNAGNWCVPGAACSSGQTGTYGTNSFALDPNNAGTVLLGTSSLGIWKTTDCGSTWEKMNTAGGAAAIQAGRNWSLIIDPTDSQVIYTVTGYAGAGFYKSTDGGRNWTQKFPDAMLKNFPAQGIEKLSLDPTNNKHLTATFHNPCGANPNGGGSWPCIAETKDGGESFTLTNSAHNWTEGDGQTMMNENTWFFSTGATIYRTTDAGKTWGTVFDGFSSGNYNTSGCIVQAHDGSLYTGGSRGMVRSTNGGDTWQILGGSPNIGGPNGNCPMVEVGGTFYVSMGLIAYDPPTKDWFYKASGAPPTKWAGMNNPAVITGGMSLAYDADHKLIYSSNSTGGFWRVVVQ